ncbi:GNAT family protein [Alkalihalobacillus sp. FSL R5-0424]
MKVHITDQLIVAPFRVGDADALFRLTDQSRESLRAWLPWVDRIQRVEDTRQFIEFAEMDREAEKRLVLAIRYNNTIVGVAGFNEIDRTNQIVKIGYWLGAEYEGRGWMTAVVKGLIHHAFTAMELNKVEIRVAVHNAKSQRIPQRLGFVNEGCIRQAEKLYDRYVDHTLYGLLRTEWKQPTEMESP